MKYDPVKSRIGRIVNRRKWLRKLFYRLLDILLLRTWHVKRAVKEFADERPGEAEVLDAGSGFGQYSWRMWRMNRQWKVLGLDVKEEQVADCNRFVAGTQAEGKVRFMTGDLTRYSDENRFDMILSVDVMEHIEDDNAVFRNFYLSLLNNGELIISTPSDRGGSDVQHEHEDSFIDEHVRDGYGVVEIEGKLRAAGFRDIRTRYTYGRPGKVSWKISMKWPVLMLNASMLFAVILPFYYILAMPFALVLNMFDVGMRHSEGTGLLVRAKK